MAFWKKSEDNGNPKDKIVRPRKDSGYWGERESDETIEFAAGAVESAESASPQGASLFESKQVKPDQTGFEATTPAAEGTEFADETIDDAAQLTEQAGDYLETETESFVDTTSDFVEDVDDTLESAAENTIQAADSVLEGAEDTFSEAVNEANAELATLAAPLGSEFEDDFVSEFASEEYEGETIEASFDMSSLNLPEGDGDADADIDEIPPEDIAVLTTDAAAPVEEAPLPIETVEYAEETTDAVELESYAVADVQENEATSTDTMEIVEETMDPADYGSHTTDEILETEAATNEGQNETGKSTWAAGPVVAAGAVGGLATVYSTGHSAAPDEQSTEEQLAGFQTERLDVADDAGQDAIANPDNHKELTVSEDDADETAFKSVANQDSAEEIEFADQHMESAVSDDEGEIRTEDDLTETTTNTDTDNIIAWPNSQTVEDEQPAETTDVLSDEERAAIEAVTGGDSVERDDEAIVAAATAIPMTEPADFAEEPGEDYSANMIAETADSGFDDDQDDAQDNGGAYYYTANPAAEPTTSTSGGGRRTALYLAGAASLSTICAVGYFLLQNGGADDVQNPVIDVADASSTSTQTQTQNNGRGEVAAAPTTSEIELPDIDFGALAVTETGTEEIVAVEETNLFESDSPATVEIADPIEKLEPSTRELSGPQTTLSTIEGDQPAATADIVIETEVPPKVVMPEPVIAPSTKQIEPTQTQIADASVSTAPTPTKKPRLSKLTQAAPVSQSVETRPVPQSPRILPATPIAASVATRVIPLPSFSGDIVPNAVAAWPLEQFAANGSSLTAADKTRFAETLHRAFDTTRDNARTTITTRHGDRASLQFGNSLDQMRSMPVQRASNLTSLPDGMMTEGGWYTTARTASMLASPNREASTIARLTPSTAVQRLGVVEQSNGDRWYAIGRNGVIVGFIHAEHLTPITSGSAAAQSLVVPAASVITETVNVVTPCRTLSMSVGGASTSGTGCLSPNGQWVMTDAPARTYAKTSTAPVVSAPSSSTLTQSSRVFAGGVAGLTEESAEVLFNPVNERRNKRHADTLNLQRLDALFDAGRSITLARHDNFYSRIRMAPANVRSIQPIADTTAISNQTCRTATYLTADSTREMTACRQVDGHWRIVSRKGAPYQIRTIASL